VSCDLQHNVHITSKFSDTVGLGDVVLNTIENQPYTAVTIALGLGWLLGRMPRAL